VESVLRSHSHSHSHSHALPRPEQQMKRSSCVDAGRTRIARWGALCLFLLPSVASAQLGVGVGVGANACLPDQVADCDDVFPSAFVASELEYRLWDVIGVGFDFDYGWLTADASDVSIETLHAMLAIRGYLGFDGLVGGRTLEAFLGLAMGYGSLTASKDGTEFYRFSNALTTWRASTGALVDLGSGLWAGIGIDAIFHHGGDRCLTHPLGQQDCTFYAGGEEKSAVIDLLRLRARVRYDFW